MMKEICKALRGRYLELAKGTDSEDRITRMLNIVVDNCQSWPPDKTGRWIGYVQCLLIEVEKVTTIEEERNATRPWFHEMYIEMGREIPPSISINDLPT